MIDGPTSSAVTATHALTTAAAHHVDTMPAFSHRVALRPRVSRYRLEPSFPIPIRLA